MKNQARMHVVNNCTPYQTSIDGIAKDSRAQSKEETIANFIKQRQQLIAALYQIVDEQWRQPFTIGDSELTLSGYFASLVDHDLHHFSQIRKFLRM